MARALRIRQCLLAPQDATKLEMGRTYEQVDAGDVAARAPGAAPTERERRIAAGVTAGATGVVRPVKALGRLVAKPVKAVGRLFSK